MIYKLEQIQLTQVLGYLLSCKGHINRIRPQNYARNIQNYRNEEVAFSTKTLSERPMGLAEH